MPHIEQPPEPWRSFFADLDSHLREEVQVHCCGGFVLTQFYGVGRTTSDVDFLGVVPNVRSDLIRIDGKGSNLHQKHKVYLDTVTVATLPEDYEERPVPMFPSVWSRLRLLALEAHYLALSKLERNSERDRDDAQRLVQEGHLRPQVLSQRYYSEFRPNLLAHEERHDLTLQLWLEAFWPA